MKKFVSMFVVAIMVCACMVAATPSIALAEGETADFAATFFPSNTIGTPTEIYYRIVNNSNGKPERIYMWLTQPDDMMAMYKDIADMDDDYAWFEKYNLYDLRYTIQLDCKVDDGEYQYQADWDRDEYQETLPYFLIYNPNNTGIQEGKKTFGFGSASFDAYSAGSEDAGFLSDIIKGNSSEGFYFDLKNHSITLRARYLLGYKIADAEEKTFIHSEWSTEVVLGKNGTQVQLEKPEKIDAPTISDLSFVSAETAEDGQIVGTWKVKVDFPKSNQTAVKYYIIEEDAFEPLKASIQYRVLKNGVWGEWKDSYWGNPEDLSSGYREFETINVGKDDTIEFRVFIKNDHEGNRKNSPYSDSLFLNAEDIGEITPPPPGPSTPDGKDNSEEEKKPEKSKCKVCGRCPIQPLGICLFIWIVAIVIVGAVIGYIKRKIDKNKE